MNRSAPPHAIALLGIGRIGMMHARILARHPLVERLVLADLDLRRAQQPAEELPLAVPTERSWKQANSGNYVASTP